MCFGFSKEQSHPDDSFEYPQHMFWLRNKKIIFCYTLLTEVLIKKFSDFFSSKFVLLLYTDLDKQNV